MLSEVPMTRIIEWIAWEELQQEDTEQVPAGDWIADAWR